MPYPHVEKYEMVLSNKLYLLIKEKDILLRIKEIAKEITDKYNSTINRIVIIGIMDGCISFLYNLIKDIPLKLEIKTIKIKTYNGKTQKNMCKIDMGQEEFSGIEGANVIIVDDILDSGHTLKSILAETARHLPSSIETAVLLDKKKTDFCANYTGFEIPDRFVVGFGMDYKGYYRNLRDIYE